MPIETRVAIARYDATRDVLELHGAAKVPYWNRDTLARMLGRDAPPFHSTKVMLAAASAFVARYIRKTFWCCGRNAIPVSR